jgi:hypothetical protein
MQMKHLQPFPIYHAADPELAALPIHASKPTRFMPALDQDLDAHRDAIAIRDHHLCGAVSGVDVQEKVLISQPSNPCALGQPLRPATVARAFTFAAPAAGSWIGKGGAVARREMCVASRDGRAQQPEETIDRIGFLQML